ncbi:MAG: hypothetical protein J2P21_32060 [Chloracidobacterium sp.]|nr:hypothetical protein [Chloracidobacterium sp.]
MPESEVCGSRGPPGAPPPKTLGTLASLLNFIPNSLCHAAAPQEDE